MALFKCLEKRYIQIDNPHIYKQVKKKRVSKKGSALSQRLYSK